MCDEVGEQQPGVSSGRLCQPWQRCGDFFFFFKPGRHFLGDPVLIEGQGGEEVPLRGGPAWGLGQGVTRARRDRAVGLPGLTRTDKWSALRGEDFGIWKGVREKV